MDKNKATQQCIASLETKLEIYKREYEVTFENKDMSEIGLAESRIEETAYLLDVAKKSIVFD